MFYDIGLLFCTRLFRVIADWLAKDGFRHFVPIVVNELIRAKDQTFATVISTTVVLNASNVFINVLTSAGV